LLTMHVAISLGHGYGVVGTVCTVGIALGAPVMGRVVDRYGLRPMLLVTTVGEATFWVVGRYLSYPLLLVCGFVSGMLMLGLACTVVLVGTALMVVDPPVRSESERATAAGAPDRSWLTPRFLGVLLVGAGAVFSLAGTEVTIVAQLQAAGTLEWSGAVMAAAAAAPAVGGLVYGALHRSCRQVVLMGASER
jgi:MFS family permease